MSNLTEPAATLANLVDRLDAEIEAARTPDQKAGVRWARNIVASRLAVVTHNDE